ncbi:MAG: flippase-like domain-containing protein [Caldilineaceae bacterium]|nr:flippase-like domain-containing protein [Caldilineaceae bacterium]HRJ42748.1 lysylphosphatidylglycerol synthase transmembrane domain-containing protein [Caldilineaceae bacterium]
MSNLAGGRWLNGLTLAASLLFFWFFARQINWAKALPLLAGLGPAPFLLYIGVNAGIAIFFANRWWLLLRGLGVHLPFGRVAVYRLIGATVSLLTPGPQFGGETVQVWLLIRRSAVPAAPALASVALDRMLELTLNLGFLVAGLLYTLGSGLLKVSLTAQSLALVLLPLGLPVIFFVSFWWRGGSLARHLFMLAHRLPTGWQSAALQRMLAGLAEGEAHIYRTLRGKPRLIGLGALLSALNWVVLLADFWLATRLVGMQLSGLHFVSFVVAARLAILLPIPAGLGALEASQILAAQSAGVNPALGLALVILFRVRDLVLALAGLGLVWQAKQ